MSEKMDSNAEKLLSKMLEEATKPDSKLTLEEKVNLIKLSMKYDETRSKLSGGKKGSKFAR